MLTLTKFASSMQCIYFHFWTSISQWAVVNVKKTVFKVNNKDTRTICEYFSKLTVKTTEWCQRRRSGAFIVNVEHIWNIALVFPLLTLNKYMPAGIIANTSLKLCRLMFFSIFYLKMNTELLPDCATCTKCYK